MRPKCKCGNIAGYWYSPLIYNKFDFDSYLAAKAYCEECADTDNWAEYEYVGFHKKDWQWLKKKWIIESLPRHNERLEQPYWLVSHMREGTRCHLGMYGGYHGWYDCKSIEDVRELVKDYNEVEIEEKLYE